MFRKMLLCSDLSPASEALVRCVLELKSVGMKEVVLAHVIYVVNTPGLEERLAAEARPGLERQKEILEDQGIRVTAAMPFGLPAHALADTAEEHDVSATLIGSHGKGVLQAATLGSVSASFLHQTRRPVLLAGNAALEEGSGAALCRALFTRVLFPTDFSETAEKTLDFVGKIARETSCPVTILNVVEAKAADPAEAQRREEAAQYLLEAKKRRLETQGAARVAIALLHGDPAAEILAFAGREHFSLIVLGGQGKGLIKEVFLGSVANQVARNAGVPVLFVPASP